MHLFTYFRRKNGIYNNYNMVVPDMVDGTGGQKMNELIKADWKKVHGEILSEIRVHTVNLEISKAALAMVELKLKKFPADPKE